MALAAGEQTCIYRFSFRLNFWYNNGVNNRKGHQMLGILFAALALIPAPREQEWRDGMCAVVESGVLNVNRKLLYVGDGRWQVTRWKFGDTDVEPLFKNCGTHEIAAAGKLMLDGRLSVTWQFLGGIGHGRFTVGIRR